MVCNRNGKRLSLLFSCHFADANSRRGPTEPPTHRNDGRGYSITPQRLAELRSNFLYWFFDKGGNNDMGDYQTDIHASNPQLHKNFNHQLPFFGFRFNYTRVSSWRSIRVVKTTMIDPSRIHELTTWFRSTIFLFRIIFRCPCTAIWNFLILQNTTHIH